jgi:formylglycine-generating enzyme required for sulfatase activity
MGLAFEKPAVAPPALAATPRQGSWPGRQLARQLARRLGQWLAGAAVALSLAPAGLAPTGLWAADDSPILPGVVEIPAGPFIMGSDPAEREVGYQLDENAYGHNRTRLGGWYEAERPIEMVETGRYVITRTPITNRQYQAFVAATGYPAPDVDPETWAAYRLNHPYERTRRYAWQNGRPPPGREDHPVVLVSYADARAYAEWLSELTGQTWRLPSEAEWEKAARGTDGRRFPWGNFWNPRVLNSNDAGPFDTLPVGSFPKGASPFGMLDPAGQVFEWTATSAGPGRRVVKGGSWDDKGCGVCRPAARHGRPEGLKHILIGFRLVSEP